MPLEFLGLLVVGGIAGIALLLHLLGLSTSQQFVSEKDARAAWLRHRPDDQIVSVLLTQDHSAALIETKTGKGLVWSFGADSTARDLDLAKISETAQGLTFTLPEFTAPKVALHLSADEKSFWRSKLDHPL